MEQLVIFLMLVVNAAVRVWQEANTERALDALQPIRSHRAAMLRNAALLPTLPGDDVQLRIGDRVPASNLQLAVAAPPHRVAAPTGCRPCRSAGWRHILIFALEAVDLQQ
jgi:hypothetical protein